MGAGETKIQNDARAILNAPGSGVRVWRNNVGKYRKNGQWVAYGLAEGSGDLIGLKIITVTPEMVGQQLAVFLSVEVKTPKGRAQDNQKAWYETIRRLHGLAYIIRSTDDAKRIIEGI